jgi:hypothetical protein
MWIPRSAAEIEEVAARGDLEETHTFDAKAALPSSKKNHDLAVDVAAMTVDGGVLLYGLGEDDNERLTVLTPVELAGAADRVAQIVQTSVAESPFIRVQVLPTEQDPARGYLVVTVPQSARAPHQVISSGDLRYYGRGAKGNRVLTEAEVASLYARRERWEADRDELLDLELARSPEVPSTLGFMLGFIRPVAPDDAMVESVTSRNQGLLELLVKGARSWGNVRLDPRSGSRGYDPDFRNAMYAWRRGADGWTVSTWREGDNRPDHTAKIDLDFDGTARFFCGRVADTASQPKGFVLFDDSILPGNLASFLAAMGAFYEAAGYVGHVDVGMAIKGIEGAAPYTRPFWGDNTFSGLPPRRTTRVPAAELLENARGLTLLLVGRLLAVTRDPSFTPFDDPPPGGS